MSDTPEPKPASPALSPVLEAAPPDDAPVQAAPPRQRSFSKTPMFTALNAARYQRQGLIREIEAESGRQLLCFVCGSNAQITRDDPASFVDLVHNATAGRPTDLLLHTGGGDIDAAEKLISLVRSMVGEEGSLRVVVPDFAKSAGTLMALGANAIVMSDSSELGPIDPQFWLHDGHGNDICHSVLTYIDAYKAMADELRKDPANPATRALFAKFDPAVLRKFEIIAQRARKLAEGLLIRRGLPFSKIAGDLMDTAKWLSHNQMIGWKDAQGIGLKVEYLAPSDAMWRRYWQLFCYQRLSIGEKQKLFESDYVHLVFPD